MGLDLFWMLLMNTCITELENSTELHSLLQRPEHNIGIQMCTNYALYILLDISLLPVPNCNFHWTLSFLLRNHYKSAWNTCLSISWECNFRLDRIVQLANVSFCIKKLIKLISSTYLILIWYELSHCFLKIVMSSISCAVAWLWNCILNVWIWG